MDDNSINEKEKTLEKIISELPKEDKEKVSRGISENAKETVFSYFTNSLNSKNSSIEDLMLNLSSVTSYTTSLDMFLTNESLS